MLCCTLLYVHSSIAIILMGKRELVALLDLSSRCLMMVGWLFLTVPWGCLLFVIVVFPAHIHLLFLPGVILDEKFNFDKHIDSVKRKAIKAAASLSIVGRSEQISAQNMLKLYQSIVLPHMEYESTVYQIDKTVSNRIKFKEISSSVFGNSCFFRNRGSGSGGWNYAIRSKERRISGQRTYIVRPVKRDWAVLNKDTPVDISI